MKKALSIVLSVLLLATAFGTGAAANPIADHSLQFEIPVVTGIDAEFSGDIILNAHDLTPQFSPENVDITLHFEDNTSEVLTGWSMEMWGNGNHFWFFILQRVDMENNTVTFFYVDTDIAQTYWDSRPTTDTYSAAGITPACGWCCCSFPDSMLDTVPNTHRAIVSFPEDFIEQALAGAVSIGLDEAVAVAAGFNVFSFALETQGGAFVFFNDIEADGFSFTVFNSDLEFVSSGSTWSNNSRIVLDGYDTYFILVNTWQASSLTIRASVLEITGMPNALPRQGGNFTFSVHTDSEWSITNSSWWVDASHGEDNTIVVYFQANTNNWVRGGSVTISTDCGEVMHVHFSQDAGLNIGGGGSILDFVRDILSFIPNNFGTGLLVGIGGTLLVVLVVTLVLAIFVVSTVFGWVGGFFRWIGGWFS